TFSTVRAGRNRGIRLLHLLVDGAAPQSQCGGPADDLPAERQASFSRLKACNGLRQRVEHFEHLSPGYRRRASRFRGQGREAARSACIPFTHQERKAQMDFFSTWYFIGIMAVALLALIGLLLYLRKQGSED